MSVTREWRVYGHMGHRQKLSFNPSRVFDYRTPEEPRVIEIDSADKTGTNEFVVVRITRNTAEECKRELNSQLSDGIFEDVNTGASIELIDGKPVRMGRGETDPR